MSVAPLRYRVVMPDPRSHEFHITLDIPALPGREHLDLVFPAWAPGSYMVRDFSRHVFGLSVTSQGRAVECQRLDKLRWRVASQGRALQVSYRVFAFEVSVRTSFLDQDRGFMLGSSLYFLVKGEEQRPCVLDVEPPVGWRAHSALPATRRNRFRARDFDQLVDEPVELGTPKLLSFTTRGTRFDITLAGPSNLDPQRLVRDLREIVESAGDLFGGLPFKRYVFMIHALPDRGGGLEHACSTTLDIAGMAFEDERGYQRFNELAAHEFFHAWNVKRIADQVLGPFDYSGENYTRLLWFHEGFTEYMESILLLRAGLIGSERYLKDLAEDWAKYATRPGRNVTPLCELSFEAWVKQYKPADNFTNSAVSYYEKGKWAGLVLDLMLRQATAGRRGLPHLFRRLWRSHGRRGRPITVATIRAAAEVLAGRSLRGYFSRFIDGTTELPVISWLRQTGVEVQARAFSQVDDDPIKARRQKGWAGISFTSTSDEDALVRNVLPDSPAYLAGLSYRDVIVAIDGLRVNASSISKRLADGQPGQTVQVTFFRRDQLRQTTLRLAHNPERKWTFALDAAAPAPKKRARTGWLRGW
jgi:predicted metalloprotease with PDZ domain